MYSNVARANGRNSADAELEANLRDAISRSSGVRIWSHALQLRVNDGVVELIGYVRTRPGKAMAENVIRQVAGVREIINNLYADTDLEIAVARALGNDPRTMNSFPGIIVGSAFGEIQLKGNVASAEIKQAVEEIAAKIPGVRQVKNQIEALEAPKPAAAAKPAAAPAAKPAAAAAKPGAAVKPGAAAKPAAKPAVKPAVKPVPRPAAKPAEETAVAQPAETVAVPESEAAAPSPAPAAESVAAAPEQIATAEAPAAAVEKPVAEPAAKPEGGAKPAAKPGAKPGVKPFRKPYNK